MKPDHTGKGTELPVAERIAYLIAGYLGNTLTEAEHDELDAWVVASEENTALFESLTDEANIEAGLAWQGQLDTKKAWEHIRQGTGLPQRPSRLRSLWPYVVAASILAAISGIYYFTSRSGGELAVQPARKEMDIVVPGKDQAVLTLANGRTIILDSARKGLLAKEGSISIEADADGAVQYTGNDHQMRYNQVATPRGGQFRIRLGDGTQVWLNAETSLRFPAGFSGEGREVVLQGEAYFEVAKDATRPFRVTIMKEGAPAGMVEVLGTAFNINAYGEETSIRTTLVEGSVRLQRGSEQVTLQPGEMALLHKEGLERSPAHIEKETGWKNGLFVFRDAPIETIGAQLARWYDLEVVYKGPVRSHFNATINRKETLQTVLDVLAATKRIQFTVDNRKLIITP